MNDFSSERNYLANHDVKGIVINTFNVAQFVYNALSCKPTEVIVRKKLLQRLQHLESVSTAQRIYSTESRFQNVYCDVINVQICGDRESYIYCLFVNTTMSIFL